MIDFKKITKELTETRVNENGEIIDYRQLKEFRVDKEPEFVKLYLNDINHLFDLPNNNVLFCLIKKMNYEGEVFLIKSIVDEICLITNIKNSTYFYKLIKEYCKKELLIKKDKGRYLVNPYYFGRGQWVDIQKIRLTIDYSYEKGKEIKPEIIEMNL